MALLLATTNEGKIREMRALLGVIEGLCLVTNADVPFRPVDEIGETFVDNALLKARGACEQTGLPVLAEDAGLEVVALNGAPGVRSARYGGEPVDYARNNALLLRNLRGVTDRRARFVAVTAVCLPDGEVFVTSGVLCGTIATAPAGSGGFGYDPLFVPDGHDRTLAEMSEEEKNLISHRRRSLERMQRLLQELQASGSLTG